MIEKIKENKKKLIYIGLCLIFIINFFSHPLWFSWDSTVYIGMSLILGTASFKEVWLPVRGISFPFLLRLFEPFGYQNKYLILLLMFIFYVGMLYIIYLIGKKINLYKNDKIKIIYLFFTIFLIVLNPIIFVYYHLVLTEFVAMTLNIAFVYLMFNYLKIDVRKDIKISIIYALLISFTVVFLYHTKQSFIGMMAIELALGVLLSFLRKFDIKNILYRIGTCALCATLLIGSIKVWNNYTNGKGMDNIGTKAVENYTNKQLIGGLTKLREIGDANNLIYSDGKFIRTVKVISTDYTSPDEIEITNEKEKQEIIKVLNNKSVYKNFTIYENINNPKNKYVLFTKNNYSIKEQLPLYFRIFFTKPSVLISSYYDGMYKTIWTEGYWAFENRAFAVQYYRLDGINTPDIAPGYNFGVEDLEEYHKPNLLDKAAFGYEEIIRIITCANQMIVPILFLITFIITIYIIIKGKKYPKYEKLRSNFEMTLLLYGMSFGCIISYIMFSGFIDRYLMPSHIPMFVGDIIFIISLVKLVKLKKAID